MTELERAIAATMTDHEHEAPPAVNLLHALSRTPPRLEEGAEPARHRPRRMLTALIAAAAVAAIVVASWAAGLLPSFSGKPAAPPASNTATATAPTSTSPPPQQSSPAPSTSRSPSATRAPRCVGAQLSARIGAAGPAAGTENILVLLHNTSRKTCYLGGVLPLTGVRADGTKVGLTTRKTPIPSGKFYGSTDAPIADLGHVSGPGQVAPGRYGGFSVSEGLNLCPKGSKLTGFTTLQIDLGRGQFVEMRWPRQLSLGCPSDQGQAGPVSSRWIRHRPTS